MEVLQTFRDVILLFLDLFSAVLDVGFAQCNIRLYGHGFERLVFAETKRAAVRVPDSGYAVSRFFRIDIRDGIEKPVA